MLVHRRVAEEKESPESFCWCNRKIHPAQVMRNHGKLQVVALAERCQLDHSYTLANISCVEHSFPARNVPLH